VLIRRRDVRLREWRIGPYKYPTIDSLQKKKKRKGKKTDPKNRAKTE
jgi:hypothetical protein